MSKTLLPVSLLLAVLCVLSATTMTQSALLPAGLGPFYIQSYSGKCLTYGTWDRPAYPGDLPPTSSAALYMDDCNQLGGSLVPATNCCSESWSKSSTPTMTSSSTLAAR